MALDLDGQISNLQDQVLRLLDEEENLRNLKKETASDFRNRINEVKAKRVKAMKDLADLKQKSVTDKGTTIIKTGTTTTTTMLS